MAEVTKRQKHSRDSRVFDRHRSLGSNDKTARFQIGKNGLTDNIITSLDLALKTHRQIRISILPATNRDRDSMKSLASDLVKKLKTPSTAKVIGFIIVLNRGKSSP